MPTRLQSQAGIARRLYRHIQNNSYSDGERLRASDHVALFRPAATGQVDAYEVQVVVKWASVRWSLSAIPMTNPLPPLS